MSLLDKAVEDIVLYPEIVVTDPDGNLRTMPSDTGIAMKATIQPMVQSGTSFRRAEQTLEGFQSEEMYRLRFARKDSTEVGAQARIEWRGQYWSVFGNQVRFNGSRKTRHLDYVLRRS